MFFFQFIKYLEHLPDPKANPNVGPITYAQKIPLLCDKLGLKRSYTSIIVVVWR
jgi:hypothetical protein